MSDYVLAQVREWPGREPSGSITSSTPTGSGPIRRPGARCARRWASAEEFVAVTVAYLIKDKGIDVAVKALAQLPEDVVLWVVGDGPEQGNLQALAQDLGLGQRVRFLGPRRNVEPFLQAADCALCPSVWAEAAGLVNLEALACGLPVVASRIGGIPEFIEDGRTWFPVHSRRSPGARAGLRLLHHDGRFGTGWARKRVSSRVERFSAQSLLNG